MSKPKTYAEKLRDPRWQKKRLEIMQRDQFTCQHCQDKASTLNVHHATYVKGWEPWEYPPHMLITVCEPCHEKIEEVKIRLLMTATEQIPMWKLLATLDSGKLQIWDSLKDWHEATLDESDDGLVALESSTFELISIFMDLYNTAMLKNAGLERKIIPID